MELSDKDFLRLWTFVKERYGVNLEKKRSLIEGRLSNPMMQAGFKDYHVFIDDILSDGSGQKVEKLISLLTTNYTYFMREDTHYKFLTSTALPEWLPRIKNNDLRTWSAGCSSGEEAYTAAMVIGEHLGAAKTQWDTTILATDISQRVLDEARKGVYPEANFKNLPVSWRDKYFTRIGAEQWMVKPELAKQVTFGLFNLMDNFSKFRHPFHIIFCRNVMIYFDTKTKKEIAEKFYDILMPGGYLFIGLSETLSGIKTRFEQIKPAIYRKG